MLTEQPIEQLPAFAARLPGQQAAMVIAAIRAGNSPGRLWASGDAGALLWDQGNNVLYLGGPPAPELHALFADAIRPASLARGRPYMAFCGLPPGDAAPPLPEFAHERAKLFYAYPHAQPPAAPQPAGLRFAALDRALLEAPLAGMDEVRDEIGGMWPALDRFYAQGVGVVALRDERVLCWCTAEYVGATSCGLGIATAPDAQRQGIATATGAHAVAACLARGLVPHWECGRDNPASARVAEKLGFALAETATFWYARLG